MILTHFTRLLLVVIATLLLTACSANHIRSDLVLNGNDRAVMRLQSPSQAIVVHNEGGSPVRIRVLDRKNRVLTDMPLGAQDRVRIALDRARRVEFVNQTTAPAKLRWVLSNDDPVEYSLAVNPGD